MAYRDGGLFELMWHAVSSVWKHGHSATYPPDRFVGLVSSLSLAADQRRFKLVSIALRRLHSTPGTPRWRLTYAWETSQPAPPPPEIWAQLGRAWESLVPGGRWGGDFSTGADLNHFDVGGTLGLPT